MNSATLSDKGLKLIREIKFAFQRRCHSRCDELEIPIKTEVKLNTTAHRIHVTWPT